MQANRVLVVIVMIAALSTKVWAASYEYENLFNARHTIIIQTDPPIVASNDRAVEARFCRPSEAFRCVTSELFGFAIPMQKKDRLAPWRFGQIDFIPKERRHMQFLGRSIAVLVVEATQNNQRMRYLYSDVYGLVAFGVDIDGRTEVFISQRGKGFAGR